MANIFKNARLMMWLSVALGAVSLVVGGIGLYYKEYVIGAALLFNVFICFTNYLGWKKKA